MSESRFDDADSIEWTTDQGSDVTVEAVNGTLFVTLDGKDETGAGVSFERQRAELTVERGTDVLDAGRQRDESGEVFNAYVPIEAPREDLEALREDSEVEPTDEPLAYEAVERTKTSRAGGWGKREITEQRLTPTKDRAEMTERQEELDRKVDRDHDVPEDVEPGDVVAIDELLDDARTDEEREADAIEEAAETGEEVVIRRWSEDCADADRECSLDNVRRVATPDGEIETRRTHTY